MLKSMTGYGKATTETKNINVTIEVKCLNSKFTDIYCRIPKNFSANEIEIRNILTQNLERGKIELNLNFQKNNNEASSSLINKALVSSYIKDLEQTANDIFGQKINETEMLKIALSMPNAYLPEPVNENAATEDWKVINETLEKAITECNDFRLREGKIVIEKFKEYIHNISKTLLEIEQQDALRIPQVRERIEKNVKDLVGDENFDKNRFEQELIYYVEKYDIAEEKTRLQTHLSYFIDILNAGNGKKLGFMAQEIGREINTIGSKANDATIQRLVVSMKEELEKIKEQTANIL
ncbi:MAG: YicC family protein [Pseudarcicella sp.]|nr:YicC family protein [Pseudarcicella sp.]MBP6410979.1 YicC family protein [Pseudarcicella sp.]